MVAERAENPDVVGRQFLVDAHENLGKVRSRLEAYLQAIDERYAALLALDVSAEGIKDREHVLAPQFQALTQSPDTFLMDDLKSALRNVDLTSLQIGETMKIHGQQRRQAEAQERQRQAAIAAQEEKERAEADRIRALLEKY